MIRLKRQEFICPVCNKIRTRGRHVRIGKLSLFRGYEMKICLRGICLKQAQKGRLILDGTISLDHI